MQMLEQWFLYNDSLPMWQLVDAMQRGDKVDPSDVEATKEVLRGKGFRCKYEVRDDAVFYTPHELVLMLEPVHSSLVLFLPEGQLR